MISLELLLGGLYQGAFASMGKSFHQISDSDKGDHPFFPCLRSAQAGI